MTERRRRNAQTVIMGVRLMGAIEFDDRVTYTAVIKALY